MPWLPEKPTGQCSEVCVGLARGEVGGGRGGVVVRDWGGGEVPGSVGGGRVVGLSVVAWRLLSVVARTWVVVALSSRIPKH